MTEFMMLNRDAREIYATHLNHGHISTSNPSTPLVDAIIELDIHGVVTVSSYDGGIIVKKTTDFPESEEYPRGISFDMDGDSERSGAFTISEYELCMELRHRKWPSIVMVNKALDNARKKGVKTITYRPKSKLHGTCAGISVHPSAGFAAQGRNRNMTLRKSSWDAHHETHHGFTEYVEKWVAPFGIVPDHVSRHNQRMVIHGEWCGRGIMKGTAANQINGHMFACFAVEIVDDEGVRNFFTEPFMVRALLGRPWLETMGPDGKDQFEIIPWATDEITVDLESQESIDEFLASVAAVTSECADRDPWLCDRFDVEGVGEGCVWYPQRATMSDGSLTLGTEHMDLMFKAKTEKFALKKNRTKAPVDEDRAARMITFADCLCGPGRIQQALDEVFGDGVVDRKKIGEFVGWLCRDVAKECCDEIDESEFTDKEVNKAVAAIARREADSRS